MADNVGKQLQKPMDIPTLSNKQNTKNEDNLAVTDDDNKQSSLNEVSENLSYSASKQPEMTSENYDCLVRLPKIDAILPAESECLYADKTSELKSSEGVETIANRQEVSDMDKHQQNEKCDMRNLENKIVAESDVNILRNHQDDIATVPNTAEKEMASISSIEDCELQQPLNQAQNASDQTKSKNKGSMKLKNKTSNIQTRYKNKRSTFQSIKNNTDSS